MLVGVVASAFVPADAGARSTRQPTPNAIATTTFTFVDTTRSTPATRTQPADDARVLETAVSYPRETTEPLPLVVLAHGLNGDPHELSELIDAWARAGFVVAAPTFPRVNVDANGKALLADAAEYPGDVSFVIDRLLAASAGDGPLHGRIDATRIGAAGMSLGGMAVYGLISNTCCLDARINAAILMSAVRPSFPTGEYVPQKMPVMLVHGDADTGYRYSEQAYPKLAPPKWFVTLRGGRHGPPFEDAPDEFDDFVRATTTSFWQLYLMDRRAASHRIVSLVRTSHGTATLQRDLR